MTLRKKIKKVRGAAWEPKVFFRAERDRWMVDCGFKLGTDKRRRQMFEAEEDATTWAAAQKKEYLEILKGRKKEAKEGTFARLSALSDTQRQHLVEVLSRVNGDTARILRAVAFYEKHTTTADASRKLADVFKEYIAAKEASGKRPRTIGDAKWKLKPFSETFGAQSITEITTADVERWMNERKYKSTTRNAYRVAILGLFNHAVKRRYTDHNPAAAIDPVTVDQVLPKIHTPKQVQTLLTKASNHVPDSVKEARESNSKATKGKDSAITEQARIAVARAKVVPYLAIGYFAGLRPENELVNLDWRDIDFEGRTIRVDPATAKKRRQRYVDMTENLVQWLTPYARKSGKIGFSRRVFRDVKKDSGVAWSKDVMRHSYGSYLLAHNEDAAKTASQMGHSDADVLFNHYRNLVKKTTAAEYWKIVPESQPNVIQLPVARAG